MQRLDTLVDDFKIKTRHKLEPASFHPQESGAPDVLLPNTRYELSLAEFPMFILSAKIPKGVKAITYSDTITVEGRPVERQWKVTWSEMYGPPTPSVANTFFALYQFWNDASFTSQWVRFGTIAALLKRKGVVKSKLSHNRIIKDLHCLCNVYIEAKNAFYDSAERKYVDRSFHLFEELIMKKNTPGSPDAKSKGLIKAHPILHKAAQNTSFLLGIPEETFFKLPSLQQRLYLHLRKMFRVLSSPSYTRRLDDLTAQLPLFCPPRKAKFMIKQAAQCIIDAELIPSFVNVQFLKNNVVRFDTLFSYQLDLFGRNPDTSKQRVKEAELAECNFNLITEYCRDTHSYPFYRIISKRMCTDDIYQAISETKDLCHRIGKGFTPRVFTHRIKSLAQIRGITLSGVSNESDD